MTPPVKSTGGRPRLLGQSALLESPAPPVTVSPAGQGPYNIQHTTHERGAEAGDNGASLQAVTEEERPPAAPSTFTPAVERGTPAEPLPSIEEPAAAENFPAVGVFQAYRYEGIIDYGDREYLGYLLDNPACFLYYPPPGSRRREIKCGRKRYLINYAAKTVTRVSAPPSLQSRLLNGLGLQTTAQFLQGKIFQPEHARRERFKYCKAMFCEYVNDDRIEEAVELAKQVPQILRMCPLTRDPEDPQGKNTLMHQVCQYGSLTLIEKLLDVPAVCAYLGRSDHTGCTPVDYLARRPDMTGFLERSSVLRRCYGALNDNGYSPIHSALGADLVNNALVMLPHASDMMAARPLGGRPNDTIYHHLMKLCSVRQLAQLSLLSGIRDLVGSRDADGQTALDIIESRGLLTDCAMEDGVMKAIVNRGSPSSLFMRLDGDGYTPVHRAIMGGCFWNCLTLEHCLPACGRIRTGDGRSCRNLVMAQPAFTPQQKEWLFWEP